MSGGDSAETRGEKERKEGRKEKRKKKELRDRSPTQSVNRFVTVVMKLRTKCVKKETRLTWRTCYVNYIDSANAKV